MESLRSEHRRLGRPLRGYRRLEVQDVLEKASEVMQGHASLYYDGDDPDSEEDTAQVLKITH